MGLVPPDQSPASRSAVKSACISSNGVCEAGRSKGAGRVIEPRNSVVVVIGIPSLGSQRGESRRCIDSGRQQSWGRYGEVLGAPPGSESGACTYRGNSGTWESLLPPCRDSRKRRGTG
jgi:hypothetical protein